MHLRKNNVLFSSIYNILTNQIFLSMSLSAASGHPTLTAYICGKIAPHPYVSYIFRNVWISSFTLYSLNLYYVVKITQKLRFKKKYRFVQISTILGLIPIVNVVISRFCAFWFNFCMISYRMHLIYMDL